MDMEHGQQVTNSSFSALIEDNIYSNQCGSKGQSNNESFSGGMNRDDCRKWTKEWEDQGLKGSRVVL